MVPLKATLVAKIYDTRHETYCITYKTVYWIADINVDYEELPLDRLNPVKRIVDSRL